jgi:tetratricopeptide (TPR) repeat protein
MRKLIFVLMLINLGIGQSQAQYFWEDEFEASLSERSRFFRNYDIERNSPQFGKWQNAEIETIHRYIDKQPNFNNLWYNYSKGLLAFREGSPLANTFFGNAYALAKASPGDMWLLFMEFYQQGIHDWAFNALENLHLQMIQKNAESIPIVAQQLIVFSITDRIYGEDFLLWARKFDHRMVHNAMFKINEGFPGNPRRLFSGLSELWNTIILSWEEQAAFFYYMHSWIRTSTVFFLFAVIVFLSLKYLPVSLYPFADLMPKSLSRSNKIMFAVLGILTSLLGGMIPFLWLITFLIWRVTEKHEKKMLAVILIFVALSPIDSRLRSALTYAKMEEHSLSMYHEALDHGFSRELEQRLKKQISQDQEDYLAQLGLAVLYSKALDYPQALKHAFAADYLERTKKGIQGKLANVHLVILGNIHFNLGQIPKAVEYYRKAIELNPKDPYAIFNLSQIYKVEMQTKDGDERESFEKNRNPRIRNLLLANESHFPVRIPEDRLMIYPHFSSSHFWLRLFPDYSGSWKHASIFWRSNFLGIPPLYSLILFFILIGLLFFKHKNGWYRKPKWALDSELNSSKVGQKQSREKLREMMQHFMMRRRRFYMLNIIFPGLGFIYQNAKLSPISLVLMVFTSLFYGVYTSVFTWGFTYPFAISFKVMAVIISIPIAYNLYFIVTGLIHLWSDKNYKEALDGV